MSGTTYTPSLRFAIMTPGDPVVRNQWGTILDNFITVNEQAITGNAAIALSGTAVTLTANNNTSDQSRQAVYNFTGALVSECVVTIPAEPKVGWVQNNTTGNQSVALTTGSGRALTITSGLTYWFTCDGTNIDTISLGVSGLETLGDLVSGASVITGGESGPTWSTGTGVPTATLPRGSLYSRSDGAVGSTLYVSQGGGTWNPVAGV